MRSSRESFEIGSGVYVFVVSVRKAIEASPEDSIIWERLKPDLPNVETARPSVCECIIEPQKKRLRYHDQNGPNNTNTGQNSPPRSGSPDIDAKDHSSGYHCSARQGRKDTSNNEHQRRP